MSISGGSLNDKALTVSSIIIHCECAIEAQVLAHRCIQICNGVCFQLEHLRVVLGADILIDDSAGAMLIVPHKPNDVQVACARKTI
jgi:hypothetical protein